MSKGPKLRNMSLCIWRSLDLLKQKKKMHESWKEGRREEVEEGSRNIARALKTIKIWILFHRQWAIMESFGVEECLIHTVLLNDYCAAGQKMDWKEKH